MRQAEAPFRQSGGLTIRPDVAACELTALLRRSKGFALLAGYCLGSGAANTLRQAAGICARVIGGFCVRGVFFGVLTLTPTSLHKGEAPGVLGVSLSFSRGALFPPPPPPGPLSGFQT